MSELTAAEDHFSGVDTEETERQTKDVKLKLGQVDPIKIYLVHNNGYLSAETTDSRDADALVTVRELMNMATLALSYGVPLRAVCGRLKYNMDGRGELRRTNTPYVPRASSVPDMIGRYLENRLIKAPIIRRMLAKGIHPGRALDPTGRLYLDWTVEELKEITKNQKERETE